MHSHSHHSHTHSDHSHDVGKLCHAQALSADTHDNEKRINTVFILTTITMVVEILAGTWFGSMALLADGWHMFTHSAAFAIAMFAYWYARKHSDNPAFAFGTGKVTSLGGFASAVALAVVALFMVVESVERLISPANIHFEEAIAVAVIGLLVNLASVFLLHDHHDHSHGHHHHHHAHDHDHDHDHDHSHDHNIKAAYFHVLADTLTSLFAILALIAGKFLGWIWLDAVMGIVGAVVILKWAYNLITDSSAILLDRNHSDSDEKAILELFEQQPDSRLLDLHVWKMSGQHKAAILSVETSGNQVASDYQKLLDEQVKLAHVTIEVHRI